jgi:hypothetical protein
MTDAPPPPDIEGGPTIAGQTLVEVIYSVGNHIRGIITVDPKGLYRVRTEVWDTGDWDSARIAFWNQGLLGTITDTLDNARVLCHERIAETRGAT